MNKRPLLVDARRGLNDRMWVSVAAGAYVFDFGSRSLAVDKNEMQMILLA
jgi:hypothetical protein